MVVIGSNERRQSSALKTRWLSSAVVRDGSPDRDFPSVVDEFCLHVKLSPHYSLFAVSLNLATSKPGHGVFACLLKVPGGLGDESHWKMSAFRSALTLIQCTRHCAQVSQLHIPHQNFTSTCFSTA